MKKLVVRNRQGIFALPLECIDYMEKQLRKICVHTCEGDLEFYGRFPEIMPYLDGRFMYCHRSYVINMDRIVWMAANQICIAGNAPILFGRDTYSRARKIFTGYMMEQRPGIDWNVRKWL